MAKIMLFAVVGLVGLISLPAVCVRAQEPPPSVPAPAQEAVAPGQQPAQGPSPRAAAVNSPQGLDVLAEILGRGAPNLQPAELAGTGPGSNPAVLTLEQAYSLTLIRARDPAALLAVGRASGFDPTTLHEEAKRVGALDFERFRRKFLSSGFRDPAPGFFAALKHRQAVDSARDQVALTKDTRLLFDQLRRGEASGVSQLQLEQVDQILLLSQQNLDLEMSNYRSAVDELKVSLGLPPSAPIVLDESILEAFGKAFSSIDLWQRNPRRQLATLSALHKRLPRLDDVTIAGRSLAQVVSGTISEAEFLVACTEAASKQGTILKDEQAAREERDALELRIRTLARRLILTHRNYEVQRKGVEVAVREVDQRFEQLINPPGGGTSALAQSANAATQVSGLLPAQGRLYRGRAELVAQWLQFKEQSLELYRELGTMPYDNWQAFHRSFFAESEAERPAP
jgi:hypothetical protein